MTRYDALIADLREAAQPRPPRTPRVRGLPRQGPQRGVQGHGRRRAGAEGRGLLRRRDLRADRCRRSRRRPPPPRAGPRVPLRLAAVDSGHSPENRTSSTDPRAARHRAERRPEDALLPAGDLRAAVLRRARAGDARRVRLDARRSASSSPAGSRTSSNAPSERTPTPRSRRMRSVTRSGRRSSATGAPRRSTRSCARRSASSSS